MKTYLLNIVVFLFFTTATTSAKNYYVAANGNNANNGTSSSTPWQTISKVNSAFSVIVAGDSILFRRGDTFYGALVVSKAGSSGRPIIISAYGTGNKPVITGFVTATSWATVSTGVYQAYIPGAKSTLNMVTLGNVPQAIGRYPNSDAAAGGYLSYETFSGATSITDNQLTSTTNWTGADVVVRKKLWVLDRGKITAHSGGKLTFTNTNSSTYTGTNNFGYFIQNDARTLDKFGEWYYKTSTKYIQMYFGTASPSAYTVKVSCLDTLLIISGKNYININNIAFEGANGYAINAASASYINIQNCDFANEGVGAINFTSGSSLLIENCTAKNCLSNAFNTNTSLGNYVTIRGCSIKNTATLPGMGLSNGNSYKAITANANNLLIEYNTVDTTGYAGIDFQGSNVNIRYNVVNYFDCIKDDAGGIYTYQSGTDAAPGKTYTNRTISNNIVMNGMGAPDGRNSSTRYASGIYLDGRTMNVNVLNNTVFSNAKNGIHTSTAQTVTISGNTSYNNLNAVSIIRWASMGIIRNLTVKKNILYPTKSTQRAFSYVNTGMNQPTAGTVTSLLTNVGAIDSNTYNMANATGFYTEFYATEGGSLIQTSPYSFEAWRALSGKDPNGKKPVKAVKEYTINSIVGANKFTNGLFNSLISGLSVYGTGTLGLWDGTGKISGGSLKVSFSTPAANRYSSIIGTIGSVSAAKKYVLRFSTYGTTNQGVVRAYIRKSASPNTALAPTQVKSFVIGRKDHEFFFNAPTTEAGASFVIELEQMSGVTYVDNLEFYEVTATSYDPAAQLRFEYNPTKVVKTVALGGTYFDVNGVSYTTVSLQPFTSVILVKDPTVVLARMAADSAATDSTITDSTTFSIKKGEDATEKVATAAALDTSLQMESIVTGNKDSAATTEKARPAAVDVIIEKKTFTINAYPNPSTTTFSVVLQGTGSDRITMQVYSLEGRLVYQTAGTGNSRYSFGSNFAPGIYILKVIQGSNTQSLKIIKAGN
ncbi:MAG: T9SS type A sorting domain-containing protein [Bacteroidota bacterium]